MTISHKSGFTLYYALWGKSLQACDPVNRTLVFIAVVSLGFALAGCDDEEQAEVDIPAGMLSCTTDAQCAVVETGCDSCCQFEAVNKGSLGEFERMYSETCRGYSGPVCDCAPPGRPAGKCDQGRCTVIYVPYSQ